MDKPERILCAAIWVTTGEVVVPHQPRGILPGGIVLCGYRHCSIIAQVAALLPGRRVLLADQGFLTSENRFVGSEAAWEIATAAGQLDPADLEFGSALLSEDLY